MIVAAPHTSKLDVLIGMIVPYILKLKIRYLAKKELFKFPLKFILTKSGGIPINRGRRSNMVNNIIEMFNKSEELLFVIAPESTRETVKHWKMGFYHIAMGANVPIVLGFIDLRRKWQVWER